MSLQSLKLRCCETFGVANTSNWQFYLGKFLMGYYCVWVKEPLVGIFYRFGLSKSKPIALLKLDDMFDLEDLQP